MAYKSLRWTRVTPFSSENMQIMSGNDDDNHDIISKSSDGVGQIKTSTEHYDFKHSTSGWREIDRLTIKNYSFTRHGIYKFTGYASAIGQTHHNIAGASGNANGWELAIFLGGTKGIQVANEKFNQSGQFYTATCEDIRRFYRPEKFTVGLYMRSYFGIYQVYTQTKHLSNVRFGQDQEQNESNETSPGYLAIQYLGIQ